MTREEMQALVEAVLGSSPVPDATVTLSEERDAAVRFGQNRITQNLDTFKRELRIQLGEDGRKAVLTTHRIDSDAVPELMAEALDLLGSAEPDPEYMPPVEGGQVYPSVPDWDERTADPQPGERTGAVALAIETASAGGMETSGITGASSESTMLGTSTGNLAYHRRTRAFLRVTMDRGIGSSYRSASSAAWSDLPVTETMEQVAAEAESAQNPVELQPGPYRMILEPQAVSDLVPFLAWSLNARQADEGLTVFTGMQDSRVTGENFTMGSMVNGALKGTPFDGSGQAARDVVWIENGTLKNMPCGRFWAKETGREPLFIPGTLFIDGGEGSVSELTSAVKGRALLFRRFWYIRFVDQKELSLTGMTRDGVFLVEDGEVVGPVKDFRWNWKPLELFSRIEALGSPVRKGQLMSPPMVIGETELG